MNPETRKISVISYESAAGRTSVAKYLFLAASKRNEVALHLKGYDVEKPDLLQSFGKIRFNANEVYADFPKVDKLKCRFCGACVSFCDCNALHIERDIPAVVVDPERCEACGQCIDGCSLHGITTRERLTGYILHGRMNGNMITVGKADDGHDFLVPLICALNRHEHPGSLSICDLGPGISGFVQTALRNSSFAIIVQRPARGWLRNIQFLVDTLKEKDIPFGLLINKFRGEEGFVREAEEFCEKAKSPLLGIIPDFQEWKDQNYVDSNRLSSEMDSIFAGILERVISQIPTSAELN